MRALTPWRPRIAPWQEIESLQDHVSRMLGRGMPMFVPEETMDWVPAMNLEEEDEEYILTAELPGMSREDVEVEVEENVLTLRGEKKMEREEKEGRWHMSERSWGTFERSLTLPRSVDPDEIEAEFQDGLLTVHLPKRQDVRGRKIPLEISGKE